ncbi:WXG100 family type VII secretion target [Williamsia sterculiae]|uniref:Proteins of 100 residues with WXG n=1 Tax=Williamsia sterculiae TaxID=1344003 RepID=A0A1N7HGQ5_9NOCA|nr:WXG100 family type VII secretion target [Williamsia sterculiae]SIS23953.1 Proteins of 100 residues with WXG [Williamsia sterculiae]
MTDDMQVRTASLQHSGQRVASLHADTQQACSSAHQQIESAVSSGWIGASAGAMQARLASMRAAADQVTSRMNDHAVAFHASANEYSNSDESSAEVFTEVGEDEPGAGGSGTLNLD